MRFQADLVDLKYDPSKGHKNLVVLVNVFTRELYAQACKNKEPGTVAPVLRRIIHELPVTPAFISTDAGEEFKGPVDDMLLKEGVVHRTKPVGNVNALSVVDRASQNLKQRIAKLSAKEGASGEWREVLKEAVDGYNETYHSAVHSDPEGVRANPVVTFMNYQDNAEKLQHNQKLLERRRSRLEDAGAFRAPLGGFGKFQGSFQPTYGEVKQLTEIKGSVVEGVHGGKHDMQHDIQHVLPVDKESSTATARFALGSARVERKREKVQGIFLALYGWLGGPEQKRMVSAAEHLRRVTQDYNQILRDTNMRLADVVRLFDGTLELTIQGYYVRRGLGAPALPPAALAHGPPAAPAPGGDGVVGG